MSRQTCKSPSGLWNMFLLLIIIGAAALMISPVSADTGSPTGTGSDGTVTITRLAQVKYYIQEDTVTLSGTNTGSGTTYLFITGPNLKPNGAQIQSIHPFQSPVIDDDASTFQAARVGPDNTWAYTWDTHNVMIDSGMYTVYAASTPRDLPHINSTHFDRISLIMAPPRGMVQPADTDTSSGGNASAGTGVTIAADGDKSYYQGEKVVLRGQSPDADTVYLFLTGPNLPATGGKLTSPFMAVVSGNPDSFTLVKTKPDKTWEYSFYTANLRLDAGTYSIYAINRPKTTDQLGPDAASVGMALKKSFITANISSPDVVKGHPFAVTGIAEGIPPEVRIWIIGDAYTYTTKTPVNSTDASFIFNGDTAMSGKLPAGRNYLIVQHPMADNQSDFVVSGDYVRNLKLNNGTNVFRLTGPGSLQGSDAADALIAAISDQEAPDKTLTSDTYTIIPFQVADAGNPTPVAAAVATPPVQSPTQPALLPFALIGAIVLVLGIVTWKRQ